MGNGPTDRGARNWGRKVLVAMGAVAAALVVLLVARTPELYRDAARERRQRLGTLPGGALSPRDAELVARDMAARQLERLELLQRYYRDPTNVPHAHSCLPELVGEVGGGLSILVMVETKLDSRLLICHGGAPGPGPGSMTYEIEGDGRIMPHEVLLEERVVVRTGRRYLGGPEGRKAEARQVTLVWLGTAVGLRQCRTVEVRCRAPGRSNAVAQARLGDPAWTSYRQVPGKVRRDPNLAEVTAEVLAYVDDQLGREPHPLYGEAAAVVADYLTQPALSAASREGLLIALRVRGRLRPLLSSFALERLAVPAPGGDVP